MTLSDNHGAIRRFLFPKVMSAMPLHGPAVIIVEEKRVEVLPFIHETPATSFISDPAAVIRGDMLEEFLLDDIDMILSTGWTVETEKRLDDYFKSSGLYYDFSRSDLPAVVMILDPGGCRVLK